MQPVIETENLSRRFGALRAVDGLAMRVERGAVYGFLGANGAGKTTTIRMLLGLIRPDAGAVRLFGAPFRRASLARVGALVESPSLYPHLTGRENLEIVRRLTGRARRDVDHALATVRLSPAAGRLVAGYSLGMRQRLGLALALLGDPELLLLDEPTNGLDPAGMREMRELIAALPGRGITALISSHLLAEVEQIASHVGIIDRGRLVFEGRLGELHARMEGRLEIRTSRASEAAQVLAAASFAAVHQPGDGIVVRGAGAQAAARINALLVAQGFAVHHLEVRSPSREEMFFTLTQREESCARS